MLTHLLGLALERSGDISGAIVAYQRLPEVYRGCAELASEKGVEMDGWAEEAMYRGALLAGTSE
jgi:hypothetical protein